MYYYVSGKGIHWRNEISRQKNTMYIQGWVLMEGVTINLNLIIIQKMYFLSIHVRWIMYDKVIVACVLLVFLLFLYDSEPCVCCQIIEYLENIWRKNDIKEHVFIFKCCSRKNNKIPWGKKSNRCVTIQTR